VSSSSSVAPMSLRNIVRALGGDLYDGGLRANVPAPGHSPRDRSVSLLWSNGRIVVHSFGAADWREVLDALRAQGLVDGANRLTGSKLGPVADTPAIPRAERLAVARALWHGGRPLAGTLAERHLRLRRVGRPLTSALRHHPSVPFAVYSARGGGHVASGPALLAAITGPTGELTAVEMGFHAPASADAPARGA
jgi:putative DNA primase/helicase